MKTRNCHHVIEKEINLRVETTYSRSHWVSRGQSQVFWCPRPALLAQHRIHSAPCRGPAPMSLVKARPPLTTTALCPKLCTAWSHPWQLSRAPLPHPLLSKESDSCGSQQSSWTLLLLELAINLPSDHHGRVCWDKSHPSSPEWRAEFGQEPWERIPNE